MHNRGISAEAPSPLSALVGSLGHELVDDLAVGLALRGFHDLAHKVALDLAVAFDEPGPFIWAGGDDAIQQCLKFAGVHSFETHGGSDICRFAAVRYQFTQHRLDLGRTQGSL